MSYHFFLFLISPVYRKQYNNLSLSKMKLTLELSSLRLWFLLPHVHSFVVGRLCKYILLSITMTRQEMRRKHDIIYTKTWSDNITWAVDVK